MIERTQVLSWPSSMILPRVAFSLPGRSRARISEVSRSPEIEIVYSGVLNQTWRETVSLVSDETMLSRNDVGILQVMLSVELRDVRIEPLFRRSSRFSLDFLLSFRQACGKPGRPLSTKWASWFLFQSLWFGFSRYLWTAKQSLYRFSGDYFNLSYRCSERSSRRRSRSASSFSEKCPHNFQKTPRVLSAEEGRDETSSQTVKEHENKNEKFEKASSYSSAINNPVSTSAWSCFDLRLIVC